MLSQISDKIRHFLSGNTNQVDTGTRKRQLDGDEVATPAKRPRITETEESKPWSSPVTFATFAEWFVRSKSRLTESSTYKTIVHTPKVVAGKIMAMSGLDKPNKMDTSFKGRPGDARGGRPGMPGAQALSSSLDRPPPMPHVSSTPRTQYSQGFNFSDTQPSFNFGGTSGSGNPKYGNVPYGFQGGAPPNKTVFLSSRSHLNGNATRHSSVPMPDRPFGPRKKRYSYNSNKHRGKMAAKQSIRVDEHRRYADLLHLHKTAFAHSNMYRKPMKADHTLTETILGTSISMPTKSMETTTIQKQMVQPERPETPAPSKPPKPAAKQLTPGIYDRSYMDLTARRQEREKQRQRVSGSSSGSDILIQTDPFAARKARNDLAGLQQVKTKLRPASPISIVLSDDSSDSPQVSPKVRDNLQDIVQPSSPISEDFEKALKDSKYVSDEWFSQMKNHFSPDARQRQRDIQESEVKTKFFKEKRSEWEEQLESRIRSRLHLAEREPPILEEEFVSSEEEEEEEEEEEFPELTEEQDQMVNNALRATPPQQVLVEGFRLQLTRKDIATLSGLSWLNDEVINFYMNLIMDRSEQEGMPKVHAFNTFFYPKVMSDGHQGVKRWTRKNDLFAKDYILVPVHLGMHWCLAVIDFRRKEIRYYDSMGGDNPNCLNALLMYLSDESLDKKKTQYDTSDWELITMHDIPQQMNGSDCGMFACKFAEFITRDAKITFSQEHMPYFRRRMVYEILTKKLL